MWQTYITINKEILPGKLVIEGTRISVELILELLLQANRNTTITKLSQSFH